MKLPAQVGRTQLHHPERQFGQTEPVQAYPTSSSWAVPSMAQASGFTAHSPMSPCLMASPCSCISHSPPRSVRPRTSCG